MQIEKRKIEQLAYDPNNARTHNEKNLAAIKGSLAKFGQQKPIVIDKSNVVIAGNGTLQAAKELGWQDIDVVVTDLDSFNKTAFALADNRTSELAEWDGINLEKQLQALKGIDFDISDIGFDDFDFEKDVSSEPSEKDDQIPDVDENPYNVKLGDIWQLGNHRLMCGDSTDKEQVDKLMNGEKADMVFTDPPYGMNLDADFSKIKKNDLGGILNATSKDYKPVFGDNQEYDPTFILGYFQDCEEIFLWGFDYYARHLKPSTPVVWDKTTSESADKTFGSNFELCWSKNKHKREIARIRSGIFGVKDDCKKRVHPTQKPVQLVSWFFEKWGNDKNLIVDLFLGSGSTLIACEKTNRKCFGSEIDPHYCSVIIKRWEDFTGQKASKL